jgi:hypothetical protein
VHGENSNFMPHEYLPALIQEKNHLYGRVSKRRTRFEKLAKSPMAANDHLLSFLPLTGAVGTQ